MMRNVVMMNVVLNNDLDCSKNMVDLNEKWFDENKNGSLI